MNAEERIQAASKFLLQSPPGEINDVLNDVRNIMSDIDDGSLQNGLLPALREYNLEQLITVDVPGHDHQCIVSEAARDPAESEGGSDRFWDPRSRTSFHFDHLTLEASDPLPVESDSESEPFREALEKAALDYLSAHYHSGVTSVFSVPGTSDQFTLQVVANKYSPSNFWSGRWRSEYRVNLTAKTLEGKILVNVHYYEQGNVQLATKHNLSLSLPPGITASSTTSAPKILAIIETEESKYQDSLRDAYAEMSEKTFKGLRRALPMTRSKLDWDRVLGYKLGAELTANKGTFGSSAS